MRRRNADVAQVPCADSLQRNAIPNMASPVVSRWSKWYLTYLIRHRYAVFTSYELSCSKHIPLQQIASRFDVTHDVMRANSLVSRDAQDPARGEQACGPWVLPRVGGATEINAGQMIMIYTGLVIIVFPSLQTLLTRTTEQFLFNHITLNRLIILSRLAASKCCISCIHSQNQRIINAWPSGKEHHFNKVGYLLLAVYFCQKEKIFYDIDRSTQRFSSVNVLAQSLVLVKLSVSLFTVAVCGIGTDCIFET